MCKKLSVAPTHSNKHHQIWDAELCIELYLPFSLQLLQFHSSTNILWQLALSHRMKETIQIDTNRSGQSTWRPEWVIHTGTDGVGVGDEGWAFGGGRSAWVWGGVVG